MADYEKIITDRNWQEVDMLNGKCLKDGETLKIKWNDGTQSTHKIIVKTSSCQVSDMGHPWTIPISKAFVISSFRGVETHVPITGMLASRVNS